MPSRCAFEVSVSAFYDPKLDWRPGPGPRRLAARQERMRVEAECLLSPAAGDAARIRHEVFAPDGRLAAEMEEEIRGSRDSRSLFIPEPVWWGPDSPLRYTLVSTLLREKAVAAVSRSFGLRAVTYHPAWGFLLNGEPMRLRGVQVRPNEGVKPETKALRAQLKHIKAAGLNMIRVFSPAAALLDACDELGVLVAVALIDQAESASLPPDAAEARAAERIRAALGHPCAVLWCADGQGDPWLSAVAQKYDPRGHAVCAGSIPFQRENAAPLLPAPGDALEATGYFAYSPEDDGSLWA